MTARSHDPDFEAWLNEARAVTCKEVVEARKLPLSKGVERVGPCPDCGGRDRFSVNTRKDVFNCRGCGKTGRSILLVQLLDGCDFLAACEMLTKRPPPGAQGGRRMSPEELAAREQARQEKADAERTADNRYREEELQCLLAMWRGARLPPGAPMPALLQGYYEVRGLPVPAHMPAVRFMAQAPYFHGWKEDERGKKWPRLIYRGPARIAAITDAERKIRGLHFTWIDLSRPNGQIEIFDPDTGEELSAKKVRGSKLGNRILLVPAVSGAPTVQVAGEGLDTVLATWAAEAARGADLSATEFVSSIDLGNLAGRAVESVQHPTLRKVDKLRRSRALRVPGPVADFNSTVMWVPESITRQILLGDGDSDPFTTRCAMERAQARHARPGRFVTTAWAPEGFDFNDVWLGKHLVVQAGREAA